MDNKLNIDKLQICRTCTKEITSGPSFFYLDYTPAHTHVTIRQKLNHCIPELDLSVVSDAVICSKCADGIKSFYEFKQKCLELEIQIKKYIQQVQHTGDVNLVEVVQFHQPHNRNLDTKFKIEATEDENLVCDIDTFNELNECTEPNEPAYLHQPHNENLDINIKVKIEDVETTEDYKIEDLVCDTNEANEITDSMEPTDLLTLEKVDRQYVLFNTVENYIDNSLSAAEDHLDVNNSNIAQDSFGQNLSKKDTYYQCYRCGHKVASKLKLIWHLKRHTPIHFHQKDVISKKPPKNDITQTGEKPFSCSVCKYQCNQKSALKQHILIHSEQKPFSCTICEYHCSRKSQWKRHILMHTGEKPFACSICEYQCIHKTSLNRHMLIHIGAKPFVCSVCEYRCNRKEHLKQHIQIHAGEKLFSCYACKYQCNKKSDLKRHILIHTGEKPFACAICNYRCNQTSALKQHMVVHTGEKPFSCSVCEYQCSRKNYLKRHNLIHTEKKPFSCL